MPSVLAVFGINNDALNTAVNVLLLVLVVVWAALIFWTFSDARRRIDDPMLVFCATAASLFPFVGTIVYAIVRPPEYLDDVRLRELEMHAAEARLLEFDHQHCPYCDEQIGREFLRCPNCQRRLKEPCHNCGKPLDPEWALCPYCEAPAHPPQAQGQTQAQPAQGAPGRRRGRHQPAAAEQQRS